jgi:IS5 family transposase
VVCISKGKAHKKYEFCCKVSVAASSKGNPKHLGNTAVHLATRRKSSMKPSERRWFKRRSAIEPVIGHMK